MQRYPTPRLAQGKVRPSRYVKTIVSIVLFLVLVSISVLFPNATRSSVYYVSKPLWAVEAMVAKPFVGTWDYFAFKSYLISKNLDLENQVTSLQLKQVDYDTILKENQDLKNQTADHHPRITSRILSKPPQSPYDTLVVDAGSDVGVAVGDTVYLSDTIIVGMVTSITSHTSLISLFSASGQKQQSTNSRTGALFDLVGKGGANFQVEVPKDTDITVGDTFLFPNKSASVLATAYYIDTDSQSSFKTIYLHSPGNVFSSQWVFIDKTQ